MITKKDRKRYRISIKGLRDQRKILHIRRSKLEKETKEELEKIDEGLEKNREMEKRLLDELKAIKGLPF